MIAFSYTIYCTSPNCTHLAEYKVAAQWSDGITSELKTYALVCLDCLPIQYRNAIDKRIRCSLTESETLDEVQVFDLKSGQSGKPLSLAKNSECLQKLNQVKTEPNGGS